MGTILVESNMSCHHLSTKFRGSMPGKRLDVDRQRGVVRGVFSCQIFHFKPPGKNEVLAHIVQFCCPKGSRTFANATHSASFSDSLQVTHQGGGPPLCVLLLQQRGFNCPTMCPFSPPHSVVSPPFFPGLPPPCIARPHSCASRPLPRRGPRCGSRWTGRPMSCTTGRCVAGRGWGVGSDRIPESAGAPI